jgi:hypothetical protein
MERYKTVCYKMVRYIAVRYITVHYVMVHYVMVHYKRNVVTKWYVVQNSTLKNGTVTKWLPLRTKWYVLQNGNHYLMVCVTKQYVTNGSYRKRYFGHIKQKSTNPWIIVPCALT